MPMTLPEAIAELARLQPIVEAARSVVTDPTFIGEAAWRLPLGALVAAVTQADAQQPSSSTAA